MGLKKKKKKKKKKKNAASRIFDLILFMNCMLRTPTCWILSLVIKQIHIKLFFSNFSETNVKDLKRKSPNTVTVIHKFNLSFLPMVSFAGYICTICTNGINIYL